MSRHDLWLPQGPTRGRDVVLDVRGLVKHYDDTPVLHGIDVTVGEHEVVALIGSSGSGKSTLLRCAALLEPVTDGQVLLDSEDITDPGVDAGSARTEPGGPTKRDDTQLRQFPLRSRRGQARPRHPVGRRASEGAQSGAG